MRWGDRFYQQYQSYAANESTARATSRLGIKFVTSVNVVPILLRYLGAMTVVNGTEAAVKREAPAS